MLRSREWGWVGVLLAVWMGVSGAATGLERGKLIVKATAEGAKMLEGARGETGAVLVERISEGPLRKICERYGVSVWEPLFPQLQVGKTDGLERVYRFCFDPSVDVSRVARDFEGLPDLVEYAEPDRRVEVQ